MSIHATQVWEMARDSLVSALEREIDEEIKLRFLYPLAKEAIPVEFTKLERTISDAFAAQDLAVSEYECREMLNVLLPIVRGTYGVKGWMAEWISDAQPSGLFYLCPQDQANPLARLQDPVKVMSDAIEEGRTRSPKR